MPSLGLPPAVAADTLDLDIPGAEGVVRTYRIPPCTARDWWGMRALDWLWGNIGRGRLTQWAGASSEQVAALAQDPKMGAAIKALMDSNLSAEDALEMPLSKAVADQMRADGVLQVHLSLASASALMWHLTADRDAASRVWRGEEVGNRAARRKKNSPSTPSGSTRSPVSRRTTTSPRKSQPA